MNRILPFVLGVLLFGCSSMPFSGNEYPHVSQAVAQDPAPPVVTPPAPVVVPPAPVEDFVVKLEGPTTEVKTGGFAVVVTAPKGDDIKIIWENLFPAGATPPLEVTDAKGRTVLMFLTPSTGTYAFHISAQKSVNKPDGFDPFAKDSLIVKYGTPVPPKPPTPRPTPTPPAPKPVIPSVPAPSADLQSTLAPVKAAIQAAPPAKVAQLQAMFMDLYNVFKGGCVPSTTGGFETSLVQFINSAATSAGLAGAFPGFSAALDKAVDQHFGKEDVSLEKDKAVEFAAALVWCCGK